MFTFYEGQLLTHEQVVYQFDHDFEGLMNRPRSQISGEDQFWIRAQLDLQEWLESLRQVKRL